MQLVENNTMSSVVNVSLTVGVIITPRFTKPVGLNASNNLNKDTLLLCFVGGTGFLCFFSREGSCMISMKFQSQSEIPFCEATLETALDHNHWHVFELQKMKKLVLKSKCPSAELPLRQLRYSQRIKDQRANGSDYRHTPILPLIYFKRCKFSSSLACSWCTPSLTHTVTKSRQTLGVAVKRTYIG